MSRRGRWCEIKLWDVLKQLEGDSVANILFGIVCESDTPEKMRDILNVEVTEEELQQINDAARWEGRQPLSFVGRQ